MLDPLAAERLPGFVTQNEFFKRVAEGATGGDFPDGHQILRCIRRSAMLQLHGSMKREMDAIRNDFDRAGLVKMCKSFSDKDGNGSRLCQYRVRLTDGRKCRDGAEMQLWVVAKQKGAFSSEVLYYTLTTMTKPGMPSPLKGKTGHWREDGSVDMSSATTDEVLEFASRMTVGTIAVLRNAENPSEFVRVSISGESQATAEWGIGHYIWHFEAGIRPDEARCILETYANGGLAAVQSSRIWVPKDLSRYWREHGRVFNVDADLVRLYNTHTKWALGEIGKALVSCGVTGDPPKKPLRLTAKCGSWTEMTERLDEILNNGELDHAERERLLIYLAVACDYGPALRHIAWRYEHGEEGFSENKKLAMYWYEQAAKTGDVDSMSILAEICRTADPWTNGLWNGHKSIYWSEQAALAGDTRSAQRLSGCLKCGICVAKSRWRDDIKKQVLVNNG